MDTWRISIYYKVWVFIADSCWCISYACYLMHIPFIRCLAHWHMTWSWYLKKKALHLILWLCILYMLFSCVLCYMLFSYVKIFLLSLILIEYILYYTRTIFLYICVHILLLVLVGTRRVLRSFHWSSRVRCFARSAVPWSHLLSSFIIVYYYSHNDVLWYSVVLYYLEAHNIVLLVFRIIWYYWHIYWLIVMTQKPTKSW